MGINGEIKRTIRLAVVNKGLVSQSSLISGVTFRNARRRSSQDTGASIFRSWGGITEKRCFSSLSHRAENHANVKGGAGVFACRDLLTRGTNIDCTASAIPGVHRT